MHMHISVIILTVEDRASPVSFGASLYSIEEKEKRKKKKNNIKEKIEKLKKQKTKQKPKKNKNKILQKPEEKQK